MPNSDQPIPPHASTQWLDPARLPDPLARDLAPHRRSELILVISFLLILAAVPLGQTLLELVRHERVQFTDVFRYPPTARNLREFEATLKDKSWFQQQLRPLAQRALFAALRDTGAKSVLGRDHWLFYRPDLRYLIEPERPKPVIQDERWVAPGSDSSQTDGVVDTVVEFRNQLKERGITLVVVPVPVKPSVYPDRVTRRAAGKESNWPSRTQYLMAALGRRGVPTVDLFAAFRDARASSVGAAGSTPLFLACDTHWTPLGAGLAAQTVAARLKRLGLAPPPTKAFLTRPVSVGRWGDVLEMMQIPGLRACFPIEFVPCEQVLDPARGPLVPAPSDRPGLYRYPGQPASVLVLGDSFCRIYQFPEPRSLGEAPGQINTAAQSPPSDLPAKRLLPGSAGFISQLALALQAPVDGIYSDGGAATDVRRKLSTNPEILEGKKVVVWEFVERDIALGRSGWQYVPLPPRLD
jgi:SGNH hydrolase-like domain, acetyltransferase AlgX